ncbi:AcuC Deacetylases, including yeast histone deacetylase and acetoin utilization protein [Acidimicrobiia bacterium]
MMDVFYSDDYIVENETLETVSKADKVARRVERELPGVSLVIAPPITRDELLLAHTETYVDAFLTGTPLHLASGGIGSWSESVVRSVLASTGGVRSAVNEALQSGVAGSLSSGLHHARAGSGAGFCTFNGLAIGAILALQQGVESIGILDVDAHCGGGTFDILGDNPQVRIGDLATSSYDQWLPFDERHQMKVTRDADSYLQDVADMLEHLNGVGVLLHNAGMDPLEGSGTGNAPGFSAALLAERETLVANWAKRTGTPVAFVLAGGYAGANATIDDIVDLHVTTVRAFAGISPATET